MEHFIQLGIAFKYLSLPNSSVEVAWEPHGVIWGAESGKILGLVAHDWNTTLLLQFFLLRITLLIVPKG